MFRKGKGSLFVVIEGLDGSGKTTLIEILKKYLSEDQEIKERFDRIIYSQEPSKFSTKFCEKIRNLVLESEYDISTKTRALVFLASRSDHIEKLIEPALSKERHLVICDRFYLSTLVYQGIGNPKYAKFIEKAQEFITNIVPDITFFLDISKEIFLQRHSQKILSKTNNALDDYAYRKFDEMVECYSKIINEHKKQVGEIIILDANNGVNDLKEKIKQKLIGFKENR